MNRLSKEEIFQWRLTAVASGGYLLDGYIIGIIGPVIVAMGTQMQINVFWSGLLGSSILVGLFFGAIVFGYVTDKVGRRRLMILNSLAFIIISVLQFFVDNPFQLVGLRFLMGLAIGADYAMASPVIAEFVSKKNRGTMLAVGFTSWYFGYLIAVIASEFMTGLGEESWRWMLFSSAVPALLIFLMRLGMPESPRWLISKGRLAEAKEIMKKYLNEDLNINKAASQVNKPGGYRQVFSKKYRKRTAFASIFWAALVAPYFAIFTFAPQVLASLNLENDLFGEIFLNSLVALGAVIGAILVNKVSRRKLLIVPFIISFFALFILGIIPDLSGMTIVILFGVFALANACHGILTSVYPPELFPTEIRATAVGVVSGLSRVGSAIGTFLLPVGLSTIGLGPSILVGAGIVLIGTIISYMWAPETAHLDLEDASDTDFNDYNELDIKNVN